MGFKPQNEKNVRDELTLSVSIWSVSALSRRKSILIHLD